MIGFPSKEIKRQICHAFEKECRKFGANSYDVLSNEGFVDASPESQRLHDIYWHAEHAANVAAHGNKIHVLYALTGDGFPVLTGE